MTRDEARAAYRAHRAQHRDTRWSRGCKTCPLLRYCRGLSPSEAVACELEDAEAGIDLAPPTVEDRWLTHGHEKLRASVTFWDGLWGELSQPEGRAWTRDDMSAWMQFG